MIEAMMFEAPTTPTEEPPLDPQQPDAKRPKTGHLAPWRVPPRHTGLLGPEPRPSKPLAIQIGEVAKAKLPKAKPPAVDKAVAVGNVAKPLASRPKIPAVRQAPVSNAPPQCGSTFPCVARTPRVKGPPVGNAAAGNQAAAASGGNLGKHESEPPLSKHQQLQQRSRVLYHRLCGHASQPPPTDLAPGAPGAPGAPAPFCPSPVGGLPQEAYPILEAMGVDADTLYMIELEYMETGGQGHASKPPPPTGRATHRLSSITAPPLRAASAAPLPIGARPPLPPRPTSAAPPPRPKGWRGMAQTAWPLPSPPSPLPLPPPPPPSALGWSICHCHSHQATGGGQGHAAAGHHPPLEGRATRQATASAAAGNRRAGPRGKLSAFASAMNPNGYTFRSPERRQ